MEIREGYKQTEVGVIPEDWECLSIGEFTHVRAGGTPSTYRKEFWGGQIKWMNSGELNNKRIYDVNGRITEEGLKNSSTSLIPSECVLMGLAGQGKTRGTVAINYVELCTNQSIAAIFPSDKVKNELLYHFLDSLYKYLRELSSGDGGRGGLNLKLIKSIFVPIPPLPEQQAIATALSDMDGLINSLQKLIDKKKKIKQGAMQELLTGKKRLEGFSGEWEERGYSDIFVKYSVKNNQISSLEYKIGGKYPVIDQGKEKIAAFSNNENKVFICPESGVIIFGDHTREIKFIDFDFIIGADGTQALGTKESYHEKYFFYNLLVAEIPNTGYNRHFKYIKEMTFKVPPIIEEQIVIANILSDMDSEIEALERKLNKYKDIKRGMMQELLTGRIRLLGEVV